MHKFARGVFADQKCHMIEMNNVTDHVHILFDLHRTEALADVVMHVKKGTSRWLKSLSENRRGLAHFAVPWEQNVPVPFSSAGSRIGSKEQAARFAEFDWQDGYGAFSLGESQRSEAIRYLQDQQNHHRELSFQDEFRALLQAYHIEYDERYLWD